MMMPPLKACHIDSMVGNAQSVQEYTLNRRKHQQRVGKSIARKRLLQNVNNRSSTNKSDGNGVLTHHRPGTGDLYLTGESSQYCSCSFLDGHDVILAASIHGDIDVLRLPAYNEDGGDKTITELTSKLRLLDSSAAYSVSTRYKLKPIRNGQAFAVGTPSGSFSVFSTEHASTWCAHYLNADWKRTVRQTPLIRDDNTADSRRSSQWAPLITNQWQSESLQSSTDIDHLSILSSGTNIGELSPLSHQDLCLKPHADALWDFWESPSSLLAAHAKQCSSGCVRVLDSRTIEATCVSSIGNGKHRSNMMARKKETTAVCFASELTLLTAQVQPLSKGKVDNSVLIWDLRKPESPINQFKPPVDGTTGENFVSFLTPSTAGKVMVTSSSYRNHSVVQHHWFDLGRHQTVVRDNREVPYLHQRNRNNTTFATNPAQDFMACYETSPNGGGIMRLFDVETYKPKTTTHTRQSKPGQRPARRPISRKRSLDERDNGKFSLSSKNDRSKGDTSSVCSSSEGCESYDVSKSDDDADAHFAGNQGFTCVASFKPKLSDRYGLTTHLACMAMNDTGTSIIGGSFDGDIFAWRGS